jgi:sortase A
MSDEESFSPAEQPPSPLPAEQARAGQVIGLLLVVGGLLFAGMGGWQIFRVQQDVANPPIPILEESDPAAPPALQSDPSAGGSGGGSAYAPARPGASDTSLPAGAKRAVAPHAGPAPTRIVAASIHVDAAVTPVAWYELNQTSVWEVPDYAAGWHQNSKLPGQGGNVVISGHHNTGGEVFRDLIYLQPGDKVTVYVGEAAYPYVVKEKFIIKEKAESEGARLRNAKWVSDFNDDRLTLISCWPYYANTHRVIVIATPA